MEIKKYVCDCCGAESGGLTQGFIRLHPSSKLDINVVFEGGIGEQTISKDYHFCNSQCLTQWLNTFDHKEKVK